MNAEKNNGGTERKFSARRNIDACVYAPPPDIVTEKLKKDSAKVGKEGIISRIKSKLGIRKKK